LNLHTIPSQWYLDKKIFELEKKNIFSKSWHLLGSTNQVPNKGDYIVKTINDQPIVLTRDNNNTLNTLYNVCQHRGCILLEYQGNSKQIKCGYHGWTYELSGDLKTARGFNKESLDYEKYRLKPIKHYIWMNQIFIKFDDDNNDLQKILKKIEKIIKPMNFTGYKYHKRDAYKIKCNWKVYMDNYLEGFHIPLVHPKLNTIINYKSYKTETFDNFSMQWCFLNPDSSPYKNSKEKNKAFYFTIYPNILFNIAPGRLQTNIIEPIDEQNCNVIFDYYFEDVLKKEINKDILFSEEVQNEDIYICEKVQRGLKSDGFNHGVFSEKYENGVSHFQSYISEKTNNG
tara:strand:- start:1300 stop:2325 length:1026 start_codon:yes stop_codon:yes gene_type:complete